GWYRDSKRKQKANTNKHDAECKWDAPAPAQKGIARDLAEDENGKVGQKQAGGTTKLRPRRKETAFVIMPRPFHRKEHGPAPFAAHADTLQKPQNGQEHRSPQANRRVAGQKCDQESRNSHQYQSDDEGRLASYTVAVMAEDEGADRSCDKANEINAEGVECRGQWVFVRKKKIAEHQARRKSYHSIVVPTVAAITARRSSRLCWSGVSA